MGSEMGLLGRPSTTSYRLPIVTIGLSHSFCSAPGVPDGQADRWTELVWQLAALCIKVRWPPKGDAAVRFLDVC